MQTKTLSLSWNCANDSLDNDIKLKISWTKFYLRVVLSTIATIFVPIDLLGPVLRSAKLKL